MGRIIDLLSEDLSKIFQILTIFLVIWFTTDDLDLIIVFLN